MEGPQFTHYTDDTLNFLWNGENRLTELIDEDSETVAGYVYDYLGRRVMKATTSEAPQGESTVFFIYDGWNVIAEYEDSPAVAGQAAATSIGNTAAPTRVLCWGRDLSGSLQGAGGVGGLLSIKQNSGSNAGTYYYGADGNGNIATIVERNSSGSGADEVAYYGYDAFGNAFYTEDLDSSGYVSENRWRFSSKRLDEETGFYYYGFRYYEPVLGRWLNRDPIGEWGGDNLIGFVGNDPLGWIDVTGLSKWNGTVDKNSGGKVPPGNKPLRDLPKAPNQPGPPNPNNKGNGKADLVLKGLEVLEDGMNKKQKADAIQEGFDNCKESVEESDPQKCYCCEIHEPISNSFEVELKS